jgi:hypothetical protein
MRVLLRMCAGGIFLHHPRHLQRHHRSLLLLLLLLLELLAG